MTIPQAKVLIVDDENNVRTAFCQIVADLGYVVNSAADGFSALAEIRKEMPDVLLSDLNMPGMSGFELLAVVRRRFPRVQVIAMSGAFSGEGVPPAVTADAFYEKGAGGLAVLFQILKVMTVEDRLSAGPKESTLAPVWIPRATAAASTGPEVMVTCPECLRVFLNPLNDVDVRLVAAECVYCGSAIQYEIGSPPGAEAEGSFTRKTGAGSHATRMIPAFQETNTRGF